MTELKSGDRVKVTLEGEVINADGTRVRIFTEPERLVSSIMTVRSGDPKVTIEKLQDPEPKWVDGDLIKLRGGPILAHCRGAWRRTHSDSIEPAAWISSYWNNGNIEILYKADAA